MWVTLSSMYGKLIVLLALAFCLTEVMDNEVSPLHFQVRSHYKILQKISEVNFEILTLQRNSRFHLNSFILNEKMILNQLSRLFELLSLLDI